MQVFNKSFEGAHEIIVDFMGNSGLPFNIKLSTNTGFAIIICYSELLSAVLPVVGNDP